MPRNSAGTGSNDTCPCSALGEAAVGTSSVLSCSQERRLFAQEAVAGLVIYLHFSEAEVGLVALPHSSAVAMACEGHTTFFFLLYIFFFTQLITCNDLVANPLSQQNAPVQGQECL